MAEKRFINTAIVIKVLSFLMIVEALFMLTSLPFAWYYEESFYPMLISSGITGIAGLIIWLNIKPTIKKKGIGKREKAHKV